MAKDFYAYFAQGITIMHTNNQPIYVYEVITLIQYLLKKILYCGYSIILWSIHATVYLSVREICITYISRFQNQVIHYST